MDKNLKNIIDEIFLNSDDSKRLSLVVKEIKRYNLRMSIDWLNNGADDNLDNPELLEKVRQAQYFHSEKIRCIKKHDFEYAARFREQEREVLYQLENTDYEIQFFEGNILLINADFVKVPPFINLKVIALSEVGVMFLKKLQKRVNS